MGAYKVEMDYEGRNSNVVVGMYMDSKFKDDIEQTGWNLCGCNDKRFNELIGDCSIVSSDVQIGKAKIVFTIGGPDEGLIEKTIQEILDGFDYYIRPEINGLRSRTGERYDFSLKDSYFDTLELA
jgi:hypothetical protein